MNIIKILIIKPNQEPYIKEIKNTIGEIYGIVYFPFEIVEIEKDVILISSLDAKNINDKGFSANRIYNDKVIHSNFVILGKNGKEFISLTTEQIEKYTNIFKLENYKRLTL